MHHINHSRKTRENEIVEYRHENFLFMITRFKRINWKEYKGFAQYQYFFYAFDKSLEIAGQQCSNTDVLNTIVRENMYPTFENLVQNLDAILSEYILVDDAIFDCLKQVEKLNPIYLDNDGKE
ncbi:hypothetical protein [Virgibacillus salexigens]|uniref:Uncharacterized protein n=1 Tax=Virgibacillus kapii TaxID=1638645 RepID=A0ABQ2DES7_9BACI|nr:hypothetical protein [Virgibacillus kapii]GGJ55456.1 hypothetical protein GCM10007111_17170 [Virgibacillus kapii]